MTTSSPDIEISKNVPKLTAEYYYYDDANALWPRMDTLGFNYSLITDLTVNPGVQLTLQEGLDIDFPGTGIDMFIEGRLQALGTVYDTIWMYSENSSGGGSLVFSPTAGPSAMSYVGFDQMGTSALTAYDVVLLIESSNVDVFACGFEDGRNGIRIEGAVSPKHIQAIGLQTRTRKGAAVRWPLFSSARTCPISQEAYEMECRSSKKSVTSGPDAASNEKTVKMRLPLSLLLSLLALTGFGQTALEVGTTVSGQLNTGDTAVYTFEAGEKHFIVGEGNQISVDLVITIKNPAGEPIRDFDGPGEGPEPFDMELKEAGTYTIELTPFELTEGDYELVLHLNEPLSSQPDTYMDQRMMPYTINNMPGATVAVIKSDKMLWQKSYGLADINWGIELSPEMRTNLGSTSKQFTAFAIGMLAEEGKLSMDDDVRKFFPDIAEFEHNVTVADLVYHTSGYREIMNTVALMGWGFRDQIGPSTIHKMMARQTELQAEPGLEWNYCNTGYALLAEIVEIVTEEDFADWMESNVFEPLNMNETVVKATPGQVIPNTANSYTSPTDYMPHNHNVPGGTNVYSTPADLLHWIRNYRTGELGGTALRDKRFTSSTLKDGEETGYGYGLFIDEQKGQRRVHHGGADASFRTMLVYYPDIDAAVIVQANYGGFPADDVAFRTAEIFFPDAFKEAEESETEEGGEFDPASFDSALLDDYVGSYSLDIAPNFVLTFRRDGEQFFTQATGQSELEIFPVSETRFELRVVDASVEFHRDDNGEVNTLTLYQNGENTATRLTEEIEEEENPSAYVGSYFCEELETFYHLEMDEDNLVLKNLRMSDRLLRPLSKGTFEGGFPVGIIEFELDDAGQPTGFTVDNGRARGIYFERQ